MHSFVHTHRVKDSPVGQSRSRRAHSILGKCRTGVLALSPTERRARSSGRTITFLGSTNDSFPEITRQVARRSCCSSFGPIHFRTIHKALAIIPTLEKWN